jgi:hypothetical protein
MGASSTLSRASDIGTPPVFALIHIHSSSRTAPPSLSHRDRAAAPHLASPSVSLVKGSLPRLASLCLCRNRAICPRSAAVSTSLPTDPAVSKISRCSVCRHRVPMRDKGRAETLQSALLFSRKGCPAGSVLLRKLHQIVVPSREASLVTRRQGEAVPPGLELAAFLSAGRTLDEFAAIRWSCTILLRFEHAEPIRCDSPRTPANLD